VNITHHLDLEDHKSIYYLHHTFPIEFPNMREKRKGKRREKERERDI